jgi:hypothetical protein
VGLPSPICFCLDGEGRGGDEEDEGTRSGDGRGGYNHSNKLHLIYAFCLSPLILSFLLLAGAPPLVFKGGFIRAYNLFSPPISAATSF